MTWSAPLERTMSTFAVLQTPFTSAPKDLAICTAYIPRPPEAPTIRTFCCGWIPPALRKAWRAVEAEVGTAAACSKVRFTGLGASMSCRAHAYSAKAPSQVPVADVEASRADPYEYVVEPDDRFVDLLELE